TTRPDRVTHVSGLGVTYVSGHTQRGPGGLLRLLLRSGRPPTSRAMPPLPGSVYDGNRACRISHLWMDLVGSRDGRESGGAERGAHAGGASRAPRCDDAGGGVDDRLGDLHRLGGHRAAAPRPWLAARRVDP